MFYLSERSVCTVKTKNNFPQKNTTDRKKTHSHGARIKASDSGQMYGGIKPGIQFLHQRICRSCFFAEESITYFCRFVNPNLKKYDRNIYQKSVCILIAFDEKHQKRENAYSAVFPEENSRRAKEAIRSMFSGRIPGREGVYSPSSISLSKRFDRME